MSLYAELIKAIIKFNCRLRLDGIPVDSMFIQANASLQSNSHKSDFAWLLVCNTTLLFVLPLWLVLFLIWILCFLFKYFQRLIDIRCNRVKY